MKRFAKTIEQRRPATAAEALQADFDHARAEYDISAAAIAQALHHSDHSGWVYKLLRGEVPFTAQMLPTWVEVTEGHHIMAWLGAAAGYLVVPEPEVTPCGPAQTAQTLREFAEFIEASASVHAAGEITPAARKKVRKEGYDAISAILVEMAAYDAVSDGRAATLADAAREGSEQ